MANNNSKSSFFSVNDLPKIFASINQQLKSLALRSTGIMKTGLAADRPAAPEVNPGTTLQYYAYDTKVLSIWNIDSENWDETTLT